MMRIRFTLARGARLAAVCALAALFTAPAPAPAQTYTIRDLGTQFNHPEVLPLDINDKGQIAGYTRDTSADRKGFFIGPPYAAMTFIGAYRDYPISEGVAINNAGVVVGNSGKVSNPQRMVIWSNGVFSTYTNLSDTAAGFLEAINDQGLIAGRSGSEGLTIQNGQITVLPVLPGHNFAVTRGVNNSGVVVGFCGDPNLDFTATKWVGGVPSALPNLGGDNSSATDIANNGLIVGWSHLTGSTSKRGFKLSDGAMSAVELDTLGGGSEALATNGIDIVGFSINATGLRAVIWDDTTPLDLNDLIPQGTGWTLWSAYGINAYGQICGWGDNNGQTRGFLLTPIEPQGGAADWIFTERDNGWTAVTNVAPFEPAEAAWVPGLGYGIRAAGFPSFGFLQSPEVPLRPARSYRLYVQIATTAMAQNAAPQIRMRALQTGNNQSELLSLDSTNGVIPSGGATAYEFVFTPLFSGALPTYRFYLDLTFFDPFDEQDAWVYLQRLILAEE